LEEVESNASISAAGQANPGPRYFQRNLDDPDATLALSLLNHGSDLNTPLTPRFNVPKFEVLEGEDATGIFADDRQFMSSDATVANDGSATSCSSFLMKGKDFAPKLSAAAVEDLGASLRHPER